MELRQLEYLVAVVDASSFSEAARRLGVAQPSISEQIRNLEHELRQPLLDRLPRRVVPTPAGQQLAGQARRILADVAEAAQRARDAADGKISGRLAIGAIPTIAPFLLPRLVPAFERKCPDVELVVTEETTNHLVEQIAHGELDLAIASTISHKSAHLQVEHIADEPLFLMLPARHRLARSKRVQASALAGERFVALHEMHCLADQSARFCIRRELRPPVVMHGSNLFTLAAMVAIGMGVSLVPAMMAAGATPARGCAFRPFSGDPPMRALTLLWPLLRYRTLAARAFAEMAVTALR